jgi:hypothetical protein
MSTANITALAMAIGLASAAALGQAMPKREYDAARKTIEADYKGLIGGCEPMPGNVREICNAQARGRERVSAAELEAAYKPSETTRHQVRVAKAEAAYAVARARCDDQVEQSRGVCIRSAQATLAAQANAGTR